MTSPGAGAGRGGAGRGGADRRPAQRNQAPRRREPEDLPRRAALDLLRAVAERDAYANLVLPGLLRDRGLTGRDAAFATELGYGTLRGQGTYDAVLGACLDRPVEKLDPPVLDVLRLGSHQLLAMRTPPHAAVSASVALCRSAVGPGPAGLVNAVLRKVSARDLDGWAAELAPDPVTDRAGYLALRHAHPRWIVSAFADALDGDWDEVEAALRADNDPPRVMLAARPGRAEQADLVSAGAEAARWSPLGAVLPAGDPADLALVRSGAAGVQDEGSQLVTLALANASVEGPDVRWLDVCAGPGGKAALLAGLAGQRGARLIAGEVAPHRARLVAAALRGGGHHALPVVADGRTPAWPAALFDRVLVDAPCTGLGALRRRPESRWRRQPGDVGRLFDLQRDLLQQALAAARPGGVVAYVTCSPHPGETRGVLTTALRAALAQGIAVEQVDARSLLPGVPDLGDGPHVQLWPHRHGTDAMFLALVRVR